MAAKKITGKQEVSNFMAVLEHPLKKEIEKLRAAILKANNKITEKIKWNAPNFCSEGEDRITMRIMPGGKLQLIFHRGAKVQQLPKKNLISDVSSILEWKTTDRAVATCKTKEELQFLLVHIPELVNKWIDATEK